MIFNLYSLKKNLNNKIKPEQVVYTEEIKNKLYCYRLAQFSFYYT